MVKRLAVGLVVIFGLALQACSPKNQDECGFVQNVYGERISWKSDVPIHIQIHKNFPEEYVGAVNAAADSWNRNLGKRNGGCPDCSSSPRCWSWTTLTHLRRNIEVTKERYTGPEQAQKDNVNVIYFYKTWEEDRPTEQARTSVYWIGDLIKEADIRINGKFNYYWNQNEKSGDVNIEALLVHEMGHVLGLKHKDTGGSVMATYLASNTKRNQLAETDMSSLKCEY